MDANAAPHIKQQIATPTLVLTRADVAAFN